ncbi:MAG: threonine--tRNA ligase [Cytophagales bacterium]|jgi:threonyl-tRNA synthetase|nr:threonine--tRNA ligase [Cytophagales bacterium]
MEFLYQGHKIKSDVEEILKLHKDVLAFKVGIELFDIFSDNIKISSELIQCLTFHDDEGNQIFWHSSAHLMAAAIQNLYPNAKLGTGPAIDNGFYYDVDFGEEGFDNDLKKIEEEMLRLAKQADNFIRKKISKEEGLKFFENKNPYKYELLENLQEGEITFYSQGNFTDLCKGPHIPNTSFIKAVKLTNISGAYWRGDCTKNQMTRIYGITFPSADDLEIYLTNLEEAKKRDHQIIGKNLKLYTFSPKVGLGLPLWLPRGTVIRRQLENFLREKQIQLGYKEVITPHIGNKELYVTSGHYEKYSNDSFKPTHTPDKEEEFLLKPMNCPHHCEIFKSEQRFYKDLPLRLAEFGTVYRYEQHGELHGLVRVRSFTQDDSHIFCRKNQVEDEIKNVIDLISLVFSKFGFSDYIARLSFRDLNDRSKYIGEEKDWERAEVAIEKIAREKNLPYSIAYGEAAFYGPKIDFMIKDALGRKWQLGTVQLDYQLPQRFNLTFLNENNEKEIPVMIHRAPFGSIERFIAVLLEHTSGKLPVWLAPDQVTVLPISEKYFGYANEVYQKFKTADIRSIIDLQNEKLNKKIREAELMKIPFLVIVGEREEQEKNISVRFENITEVVDVDNFVAKVRSLSKY